ncbi:transmembrane protein, putative [Medicago truncatula]|uniref:Transmembrane protein, putative n=1 Tax=Medicago truncatula TaxID=3880 RepID=A0A072U3Y9_MEDTR|nr:transmembrane protein, putative [Medicago truncatula]
MTEKGAATYIITWLSLTEVVILPLFIEHSSYPKVSRIESSPVKGTCEKSGSNTHHD